MREQLEDPGGVEPLAHGLKARCPTVSGLNAPGPSTMTCGGEPPRFGDDGHGDLLVVWMVLPHGIEPRSSGYRPGALPLSYGRICWCFVADSNRGSPACRAGAFAAKLTKRLVLAPGLEPGKCRCVRPMPWPLGEASNIWCTLEDLNLHAVRRPLLRRLRLPFRHECIAKIVRCRNGGSNAYFPPYQSGALPLDDCGRLQWC